MTILMWIVSKLLYPFDFKICCQVHCPNVSKMHKIEMMSFF